jgi:hypothetical protein
MSALTTHTQVTNSEKREKEKKGRKTQASDQKLNKSQEKIT